MHSLTLRLTFIAVFWLAFQLGLGVAYAGDATPSEPSPELAQAREDFFGGRLSQAKTALTGLARDGSAEAHYYLALIDQRLPAPERDLQAAIEHLEVAARAGYAPAMSGLGDAYDNGAGVPRDPLRALDWYRRAESAAPFDPSTVELFHQEGGALLPESYAESLERVEQEARAGDVEAQLRLARLLDRGPRTPKSEADAFGWYRQAAQGGNDYAQLMLGYFYCRGIGVEADSETANAWLRRSRRNAYCDLSRGEQQ